ncbi:iron ABC transporter substrate-binding protein [soil metagenome]
MTAINRRRLLAGLAAGLAAPHLARAQEETLTVYSGQHEQTTSAVVAAFTRATGVAVDVRRGASTQLASLIVEEGAVSPADVFYSEESPPIAALDRKGLLQAVSRSALADVPAIYSARNGNWLGVSARCRVVAYNMAMVKEADLPPSILDFAVPAWKDRVAFAPSSGALSEQIEAVYLMHGHDTALAWLKGLKNNGRVYNSNSAAMQAVERGEIAAALINNYYWFTLAQENGAQNMKSALHYIGRKDAGALVTVSAAGILKTSSLPELAQSFLAFMVSAAGQAAIAKSMAEYPLKAGIASPYALKPFDELDPPAITPDDLGDAPHALGLQREAGLA